MEVTFKKLLKCLRRSGRQALVAEMLKEELTREKILGYVSEGVVYGINHGINAIPVEKRGTLHTCLSAAHGACGRLLEVTDPSSDGGETITADESKVVADDIGHLTSHVFTDEIVEVVHAKIIEKVP